MSIFNMDDVNVVLAMSHKDAMNFCKSIVQKDTVAKPVTKNKALRMISTSRNSQALSFAMASWILAHPSEGLKVLK